MNVVIFGTEGPRLRARRVDENRAAQVAIRQAKTTGKPVIYVTHGGGVANSYGYKADTEGCVAIATPDGRAVVWVGRLPANKVTPAAVCRRVGGDAATLAIPSYDDRYNLDSETIAAPHLERAIAVEVDRYAPRS